MKVVIVVEGGCVIQVQSDQAACEVEVVDLDAQELEARQNAVSRYDEIQDDPEWKVVA